MATITLSVPDKLKSEMDKVDVINWSSVARHAFIEQLKDLEKLKMLKQLESEKKSDKVALKIGEGIKEKVWKKYKKKGW